MTHLVSGYRKFVAIVFGLALFAEAYLAAKLDHGAPDGAAPTIANNAVAVASEGAPPKAPGSGAASRPGASGNNTEPPPEPPRADSGGGWSLPKLWRGFPRVVQESALHFLQFSALTLLVGVLAFLYSRVFWRFFHRQYCLEGDYIAVSTYTSAYQRTNCSSDVALQRLEPVPAPVVIRMTIEQDVFHASIAEGYEIDREKPEERVPKGVDLWESEALAIKDDGKHVVLSYSVDRMPGATLSTRSLGIETITVSGYEDFYLTRYFSLKSGLGRLLKDVFPFLHGRPRELIGSFFAYSDNMDDPTPLYYGTTLYERVEGQVTKETVNELCRRLSITPAAVPTATGPHDGTPAPPPTPTPIATA